MKKAVRVSAIGRSNGNEGANQACLSGDSGVQSLYLQRYGAEIMGYHPIVGGGN